MRLLHIRTFRFTEFEAPDIPPYAVASHRWTAEEASIRDFLPSKKKSRWRFSKEPESPGVRKVKGFCHFIAGNFDDIDWLWIDTCCINQESSAELHESINSMFQWYQNAAVCLAYLVDVEHPDDMESFQSSVWFRRGWTLQELLAPAQVIFLTRDWTTIGFTGYTITTRLWRLKLPASLNKAVSTATGIPVAVVLNYRNSWRISVEDKFAWMRNRRTKKPEDMAYSLLGLFGVFLPLIYGEGEQRATKRLRDAIAQDPQPFRSPDTATVPIRQLGSSHKLKSFKIFAAGEHDTGRSEHKTGTMLYDFMAQGDDEVTVAVGDEVVVLDDTKNDDWWQVRRLKNGKSGVVPSSYVEITGTTSGTSRSVRSRSEVARGPSHSPTASIPSNTDLTVSQRGVTAGPSHILIAGPQPRGTPSTEHDDPILKRLVAMGYPRTDALAALNMYDYNIDKAVDHLALIT